MNALMRLVRRLRLRFSSRCLPILTFLLITVTYKLSIDEYRTYVTHQDTHPSKQQDNNINNSNNIRASARLRSTIFGIARPDSLGNYNNNNNNSNSPAENIYGDMTLDLRQDWVEVPGSRRSVFLYSAYLDRRGDENVVRIITIIKKNFKVEDCVLLMEGGKKVRVSSRTMLIHEDIGLAYCAAFVLCDLSQPPSSSTPMAVSLTENSTSDNKSTMFTGVAVQDLATRGTTTTTKPGNMSVCVKPFHHEYNRAIWLVEFIEYYRLQGATKFTFYNHTMGQDVASVLRYYENLGLVLVLPWSLPVQSKGQIRTEGLFAALNDCNLRSIGLYTLTAMVDVDEFLVPKTHTNLLDLVASYKREFNSYIFKNAFFYMYWENDTTAVHDTLFPDRHGLGYTLYGDESLMPYLVTAYKTRRQTKLFNHGKRSKYLSRPEMVVEVGNHHVWQTIGPALEINVDEEFGLSHHYRVCELGGFNCINQPSQIDRTAHRWMKDLAINTANTCTLVFNENGGRCPVLKNPPLLRLFKGVGVQ
ncbi:hypothetical protein Pcinc_020550 [Petrolisthes cinctipes]|uniref:Glycosyltransferase family 92 protein n=1 Tax=Petrolisthes cinctipes TaxID=88211 RepID=A0AAE1FK14_PETCI|nr:hypothetical protein Pcinc_020550 [Petrolisthes cinctipes]